MPGTLLIVDDEPHIRLLLEQSLEDLEDEGVRVLSAADGEEALTAIRCHRPNVVFLDVMMPRRNGFDVCAAVKADPDLAGVSIVLLTAKGQEIDREHGEAVGADMYLTKPFDPDDILAIAERLLGLA